MCGAASGGAVSNHGESRWSSGHVRDPETGISKRVQKFITFRGTKRKAQDKLDGPAAAKHGEFVEPSKMTSGAWLTEWLDASVKPRCGGPATYTRATRASSSSHC